MYLQVESFNAVHDTCIPTEADVRKVSLLGICVCSIYSPDFNQDTHQPLPVRQERMLALLVLQQCDRESQTRLLF